MKQKILNALKTEYAKLGLSEKALDGVASFLEKTITDENGIDAAVKEASVAGLLKVYQSEMDSERGKAAKAAKDFEDYKKAHPEQDPGSPAPAPTPEENETLKLLKQMSEEITALKTRNEEADRRTRNAETIAKVREALKGDNCGVEPILNLVLANAQIEDADTVESLTARYKADYQAQYKTFYGDGQIPPVGGSNNPEPYKQGKFGGVVSALQKRGDLPKDE